MKILMQYILYITTMLMTDKIHPAILVTNFLVRFQIMFMNHRIM